MDIFYIAGISIAVLIEFLLVSKKQKSDADIVLTVWMFLILIHLFLFYIGFTGDVYDFPFLLGAAMPLPLVHSVLLFLYVSFLTGQLPEKKWFLFLHFIPAAGFYIYLISFFILPAEEKIQIFRNHGAGYEMFETIKTFAIAFSGIFYVGWSALLLRKHRSNIRDQFSDLEKINLNWLRILTYGMGGIWFLVIFFANDALVFSGVVIFIFLIAFFGIRQADIFAHNEPVTEEKEQKEKYQKSGLTEETAAVLHQQLTRLMTEDSLYTKSDLSISDLASQLGVHPNYLSQVINEKEGKNFYDFVNTYRLEQFKRLIAVPKNRQLTLLSLAFDCGFNSKSSFNRFFKKATGQTPSEYFETLQKEK